MWKKLTTEHFKETSILKHGDKYDYSESVYVNKRTKIKIICPIHGEFWQCPQNHMHGQGCPECGKEHSKNSNRSNNTEFVEKAKNLYGDTYDFSETKYTNSKTKVTIICPKHGKFTIRPNDFLCGHQCPKCGTEKSHKHSKIIKYKNIDEFIEVAKEKHNNKYDYSESEYIDDKTKIKIICPIHGEFWQTPNSHLTGRGCYDCGMVKFTSARKISVDEYKNRIDKLVGDEFTFNVDEYVDTQTKMTFKHENCGRSFIRKANAFLINHKCPHCFKEEYFKSKTKTTDDFIKEAIAVHGNKYDYSETIYTSSKDKVDIICLEHGKFSSEANSHLQGHGCPICKESKLEREIRFFLINNNIDFEYEKHFDWLGMQSLDFYLPQYNVGIECQGGQHFYISEYFGGEKTFEYTKERDKRKLELCNENGVKLFYFSNLDLDYPYEVFEDKEELLNEIKKHTY